MSSDQSYRELKKHYKELEKKNSQLKEKIKRLENGCVDGSLKPELTSDSSEKEQDLNLFSTFMDYLPGSVFIKDKDSRTLYVNYEMKKRFGAGKWKNKLPEEIFPGDAGRKMREDDIKTLKKGYHCTIEQVPGPEDREYTYLTQKFKIDREGKEPLIGGIAIDITEQKQVEETLSKAQKKMEATLNSIGDAVIATDTEGKITQFNPVAEDLTGWNRKNAIGKPIHKVYKIVNAKTREIAENPVDLVLKNGKTIGLANHTVLISRDGKEYQIADSAAPIIDEEGKTLGVILVFRNLTDRYKTKENLLKARRFNQQILNILPNVVYIHNLKTGSNEFINKEITEQLGYSPEELKEMGQDIIKKIMHPDDIVKYKKHINELDSLRYGEILELEYRMRNSNNEWKWYLSRDTVFKRDKNGDPEKILGTAIDITDIKRSQESLRKNEENLKTTLNSIGDGVIATDLEGQVVRMNPIAAKLTGWSITEAIGKPINKIFNIINVNTKEVVKNPVDKVLEQGKIVGLANDTMLISKNGKEYQIADSGSPIKDKKGNLTGVVLVFRDVTKEYILKKDLEAREKKYRDIFESVKNGLIIADFKGNIKEVNPAACEIYGYTREEMLNMKGSDLIREDYHPTFGQFVQSLKTTGSFEGETIDIGKDGSEINIAVRGTTIKMDGQNYMLAVLNDITKRKKYEEHIAHLNSLLKAIMDVNQIIVKGKLVGEVMQKACETLLETRSYIGCSIGLLDEKGEFISPIAEAGSQNFCGYWYIDQNGNGSAPTCIQKAVKTNQIVIMNKESCSECLYREFSKYEISVTVPMHTNHELIGLLHLGLDKGISIDEEEKELLQEAACDLAFARDKILSEEELEETKKRLELAIEGAEIGIWDWKVQIGKVYFDKKWAEMLGYTLSEIDQTLEFWEERVHPQDMPEVQEELNRHLNGETEIYKTEHRVKTKSGDWKWILDVGKVFERDSAGKPVRAVGIHIDIDDRKKSEEEKKKLQRQLLQTQKLESIGTLAGGVAHDFNNILTVIIGLTELVISQMKKNDPNYSHLKSVLESAKRAAKLTRQLLLFSRKQDMDFELINLNETISRLNKMLNRLIGEYINMKTAFDDNLWRINADENQIEQIITNLVINARDAMPEGGQLIIGTRNINIDEIKARSIPDVKPGDYVLLTIEDTGIGIDKKTQKRIFDPFFTTKGRAEGTGMGLAVVHGIIKKHHGFINVYSEPGEGTIFKIYFPAIKEKRIEEKLMEEADSTEEYYGDGETILIVEDEEPVLKYLENILNKYGYNYYSIYNGEKAIQLFQEKKDEIELLISDVILTGMDGVELAKKLRSQKQDLKVILSSGYSDRKFSKSDIKKRGYKFIQKPYDIVKLLKIVYTSLKEN